jgi:hypothetical protein
MFKSRRVCWAIHVAGMVTKRKACHVSVRNMEEIGHLKYLDMGERITLITIHKEVRWKSVDGFKWLRIGTVGELL